MFEEDFMKFRDGNAGKFLHNKCCDASNYPELKVEMKEVDMSQKKNLTGKFCKFKFASCYVCKI